MADYTDIKQRAQEIRDEVRVAANTANRVGVVLELIIDAIEQENKRVNSAIEDILTPYAPLHITRGRLGLRFGPGLYVEGGVLCATGGGGGGSGEGVESYIPGNGLELTNNILSVKLATDDSDKNISGLEMHNGGVRIKCGTGLGIDTEKGQVYVNYSFGTGLATNGNDISVDYGTGLAYDAVTGKIHVNYGTGLAVSGGKLYSTVTSKTYVSGQAINVNDNEINVKYDGVTISTKDTADYSLHVVLGNGLKQGTDGVEVAYGTGLSMGNDGKLYSTVQSKTYTAGNGIDINGSSINVETPIINLSTRVYDMGNYSTSGGAESAAAGASIAGNNEIVIMRYTVDDTKQEGVILQQVGGNSTVQYLLWGGAMYIRTITFSDTNKTTVTQVREWWKLGAARTKYDSSTRKIHLADAWGNNINGSSNAVLPIASTSVSGLMSTSQVETLNSLGTSKQDKLTRGNGINLTDNTLSVKLATDDSDKNISGLEMHNGGVRIKCGTGLGVDTDKGQVYVNYSFGTGLATNGNDISVDYGTGLAYDAVTGKIHVNYGTGLAVNNNKIYVDTSKIAGAGIDIDINNNNKLSIGTEAAKSLAGSGLIADGTKMKVDAENLTVENAEKLAGKGIGNFMTFVNTGGNYVTADFNDSTLSKIAGEKYIEFWDDAGGWFNSNWGKVTAHGGFIGNLTGTASNASALQGYAAADIDHAIAMDRSKVIDLTALQDDKWYPCTLQLVAQQLTEIRIWNCLTSESIPSWSTHKYGFSLQVVWEVTAGGWGAQAATRKIHMSQYNFANAHPCGGITQNTLQSVEIVWLRGGAKYLYHTNNGKNFAVHADGYSWSGSGNSFTAAVRTASQITSPISGYSGTGSISAAAIMYADAFRGLADKATADANGNNIASTYQKKISATYGLEMTGEAAIGMPLLGAMLKNGAVDGSKNGAQRVLELSCGAIQIKLSTGLAIDELGHLYVTK